ncbi:hypothetical protein [Sutcliffiella rhizosphaerae]|uniref:Uncharacterized protein n=1 Tax=Sutcliffiella rhizosphaerae TaxID=2880967 RepID=A0ABM8YKL7_9BACI|nr:hypothetical protein [Sutcliffiella rhizosphaerae]CAG9620499.1 hypothetical protein BACCIP111883_01268 [Sutcliffiella rhizosphaerae]
MYRIPVPYFKLRDDFQIIDVSQSVTEIFFPVVNFQDLVDLESKMKLRQLLHNHSSGKMELNLKTVDSPTTLFTVYYNCNKHDRTIHLVCMNETSSYENVKFELEQWRHHIQTGGWKDIIHEPTTITEFDIKHVEKKIDSINELLGFIQNELNQVGKLEYMKLIQSELDDIKKYLNT